MAPLTLIVSLAACGRWVVQPEPVETVLADEDRDVVRVTLADGERIVLTAPRVDGDTLRGSAPIRVVERSAYGRPSTLERAIPLTDVKAAEVSKVDAGKTALLVAGIGLTVLSIAALEAGPLSDVSVALAGRALDQVDECASARAPSGLPAWSTRPIS